jgi:exosortase A
VSGLDIGAKEDKIFFVRLMSTLLKFIVRAQDDLVGRAEDVPAARAWQQALVILCAAWIVVLYSFWDTVFAAVAQWRGSDTFSHGFLVFPITISLIWSQRAQVISRVPAPNYWGLPILAMLSIGWLLGYLGAVLVVQQMAVVAMLQLLVFTVVGWPVTRALLFPLFFLIFAVPFGEDLVRPLQDYTAFFTVKALQLTGIPVYREGWMIVIPSGVWEVAEACAGVRYVIPSVILGCLFSYCVYRSWGRRLGFIAVCFIGAIVANGIRAYGIVMLAHLTNNRIAVGADHLVAGWIFFSVVVFLLFWLGLFWRESTTVDIKGDVSATEIKAQAIHAGSSKAVALTALGAVAILGLAPLAAHSLLRPLPMLAAPMISAPGVTQPWRALDEHEGKWKPRFLGADAELLKSYIAGGQGVHLFIAYYRPHLRQGTELISGGNVLTNEKNWRAVSAGSAQAMVDGESISVERIVLRSNDRTRLVWSWYWVGGEYTSDRYFAKLLELKSRLLREQKGSAFIAIAVEVENGNLREAAETLGNFLRHVALVQTLKKEK